MTCSGASPDRHRSSGSPRRLSATRASILLPTGSNPDHYDVQLLPGRVEGVDPEAGRDELRGAVLRLLLAAGEFHPNPAYAGEVHDPEGQR